MLCHATILGNVTGFLSFFLLEETDAGRLRTVEEAFTVVGSAHVGLHTRTWGAHVHCISSISR